MSETITVGKRYPMPSPKKPPTPHHKLIAMRRRIAKVFRASYSPNNRGWTRIATSRRRATIDMAAYRIRRNPEWEREGYAVLLSYRRRKGRGGCTMYDLWVRYALISDIEEALREDDEPETNEPSMSFDPLPPAVYTVLPNMDDPPLLGGEPPEEDALVAAYAAAAAAREESMQDLD